MDKKVEQFDKFSKEFFRNVKFVLETTDINIIGNKVEIPISKKIIKLFTLFADRYISKYHRDIDYDTLISSINILKKKEMIYDNQIQLIKKKAYNEALSNVQKLIKK